MSRIPAIYRPAVVRVVTPVDGDGVGVAFNLEGGEVVRLRLSVADALLIGELGNVSMPILGKSPVGNHAGVPIPSIGIELTPLGLTPAGKLVRVNVYTDHPDALCFESLSKLIGGGQPLPVGVMEFVTVIKEPA